jgi:hypothetical protein
VTGVNVKSAVCLAAILVLGSFSGAQAQSVTVALWHMDETSGSTMVDAVGHSNGSLHSVTTGVAGAVRTAYDFDGSRSYVSVPSTDVLNPGASPMQFSVSLRITVQPASGATKDYDILRKGVASTKGGMYKMEVPPSGAPVCRFAGSQGDIKVTAGQSVVDGRWHTVTCARTGSGISVSVDGKAPRTHSGATGTISNSSALVIGAKPGSDYTKGSLDEISVSVG